MTPYLIGAVLAIGVLWVRSGRSPFVWISWLALHMETIRLQLASSAYAAFVDFRANYSKRAADVRAEAISQ